MNWNYSYNYGFDDPYNTEIYNYASPNTCQEFNNQVPSINLIIISYPQPNPYLPQNYQFNQSAIPAMIQPSTYLINNQPNQPVIPAMIQSQLPLFFNNLNTLRFVKHSKRSKKLKMKNKTQKKSKTTKNKEKKEDKEDTKAIKIPFSESSLNGIFYHFRTKSNINEEVHIHPSSGKSGDFNFILNIRNSGSTYWSNFSPNQSLVFEFLKHKIVPTNYTIKTYSYANNGCHLKSWVLEGSNDCVKWEIIHEEKNCSHLNGSFFSHTFSINQKADFTKEGFKFIRIRQCGVNWHNDNRLVLCAIEFYGKIL